MKKKIAILTENDQKSGSGHFMRMRGLNLYLKKKKLNCKIFLLNRNNDLRLIKKYDPKLIVCDLRYYGKREYLSLFRNKSYKIINIENYDNSNYDLNISVIDHNKRLSGKRIKGLNFSMIRSEIKKKFFKKDKNLIFVNLGSKESLKKIKEISISLRSLSANFKFVIITKFSKHFNDINTNNRFKYYSSQFFLKYFKSSMISIINGGLTLVEALYLKKKIIIIPQTRYEKKFSEYLKKRINTINIGTKSINNNSINKLISKKNKVIIDGFGYNRIYKVLSKF